MVDKPLGGHCRKTGKFTTQVFCTMALLGLWPACHALADTQPSGNEVGRETQILVVSSHADSGPGSLRAALKQAGELPTSLTIVFGTADGPFAVPQVIELKSPLPVIETDVKIDGFIPGLLWKAYGATVSGNDRFRVFEVAPGGILRLGGITVTRGHADFGAGILNRGTLIVQGVTLLENHARESGGAITNQGGEAIIINSTAHKNSAKIGGAVANLAGKMRLTNVTLHQNQAETGSAVFSGDHLVLNNSILTGTPTQCVNQGSLVESRHNIFSSGEGCGEAILSDDPQLGALNHYNGPTRTIPISGFSPARNLGDNTAATDDTGNVLVWDQRGNGDPRFARGFVDIGAFEHQSQLPDEYVVDTLEEIILRGCSEASFADCPFRSAVELSLAGRNPVPIRFDPEVFSGPQVFRLEHIPENFDQALIIDGEGTGGITINLSQPVPWQGVNGVRIEFPDPSGSVAPD